MSTVLTWLGHACVSLEKDGFRIITDPYADDSVPGLPPIRETANLVLKSHDHGDHNAVDNVVPQKAETDNPFKITEIHSYHDDAEGTKRGTNIIRIFDDGQHRIAHMGDIGCMPSEDALEQLKNLTVMFVPVGGFFTLEPDMVYSLIQKVKPRITVPMHYRSDNPAFGYPVIKPLSAFTQLVDNTEVFEGSTLRLPEDIPQDAKTLVLKLLL